MNRKSNKNLFQASMVWIFLALFSMDAHAIEPIDIRPFRISSLEGKRFDSRKALGEPIVISFFFTRCPPCWKEMPELFSYMKKENRLNQLLFVDSYVKAKGIEVDGEPDTKRMVIRFVDKLKINPANVYFDTLGSLLKKFLRIGAFPKAKAYKTKIIWPTILVISPTGKLVESIEGSRSDFIEIVEQYL